MVETAKRYGRVVSGGSQRVLQDYKGTVLRCWNGSYGKINSINVNVGPMSQPCNLTPENQPDDIDWEMWLGPAPWAPYNSKRCSGSYSTSGNSWSLMGLYRESDTIIKPNTFLTPLPLRPEKMVYC